MLGTRGQTPEIMELQKQAKLINRDGSQDGGGMWGRGVLVRKDTGNSLAGSYMGKYIHLGSLLNMEDLCL